LRAGSAPVATFVDQAACGVRRTSGAVWTSATLIGGPTMVEPGVTGASSHPDDEAPAFMSLRLRRKPREGVFAGAQALHSRRCSTSSRDVGRRARWRPG